MRNVSVHALGLTLFLLPMPSACTRPIIEGSVKQKPATPLVNIVTFQSTDGVVQIDKTGKGAVLCVWGLYQAVKTVGLECHQGEDAELQNELKRSLDRIDNFIITNSKHPVTRANIEYRRLKGLEQLRSSGNICTGDLAKLYDALRSSGAAPLRAQTNDLLSIRREPVMNPCL